MKKAIAIILLLFVLGGCMTIPNSRFIYDNDEQIVSEGVVWQPFLGQFLYRHA